MAPILEFTMQSSEYRSQMVVVARHRRPALDGWQRVMTIVGVACVNRHVRSRCPALFWSVACGDDSGCSLCRSSCSVLLSCSLEVSGVSGL